MVYLHHMVYLTDVANFEACPTSRWGWQTSGKRRILGHQWPQFNANAWIDHDFGFQSDGKWREQHCKACEASSIEAEAARRLFQESHRECSFLEKNTSWTTQLAPSQSPRQAEKLQSRRTWPKNHMFLCVTWISIPLSITWLCHKSKLKSFCWTNRC